MPATLEDASEPAVAENGALNKTQKLAALLVMLGAESAAAILKQFQPREIESVSREMARFNLISRDQQQEILQEFSEVAIAASTSVSAGVEVTRNTLERVLGTFKAGDLLDRVAPGRVTGGAMHTISEMDPRHIFNLIRDEQVQAITFVISHLTPEKGAQVMSLLRPEQRDLVVERLATLVPTPAEVADRIMAVFNAKLGVKHTRALTQTGGITTAADMLNAMDKATSRTVLEGLEARNADLYQAIRKKMFTFEDLLRLDPSAVQRIMREIEMRDLTFSLKKASEPLKKLLLSNISRRAAEAVQEELAFLGNIKHRDIEAAQFRIIDVVRKLEAEGEIEVETSKNEEDEVG